MDQTQAEVVGAFKEFMDAVMKTSGGKPSHFRKALKLVEPDDKGTQHGDEGVFAALCEVVGTDHRFDLAEQLLEVHGKQHIHFKATEEPHTLFELVVELRSQNSKVLQQQLQFVHKHGILRTTETIALLVYIAAMVDCVPVLTWLLDEFGKFFAGGEAPRGQELWYPFGDTPADIASGNTQLLLEKSGGTISTVLETMCTDARQCKANDLLAKLDKHGNHYLGAPTNTATILGNVFSLRDQLDKRVELANELLARGAKPSVFAHHAIVCAASAVDREMLNKLVEHPHADLDHLLPTTATKIAKSIAENSNLTHEDHVALLRRLKGNGLSPRHAAKVLQFTRGQDKQHFSDFAAAVVSVFAEVFDANNAAQEDRTVDKWRELAESYNVPEPTAEPDGGVTNARVGATTSSLTSPDKKKKKSIKRRLTRPLRALSRRVSKRHHQDPIAALIDDDEDVQGDDYADTLATIAEIQKSHPANRMAQVFPFKEFASYSDEHKTALIKVCQPGIDDPAAAQTFRAQTPEDYITCASFFAKAMSLKSRVKWNSEVESKIKAHTKVKTLDLVETGLLEKCSAKPLRFHVSTRYNVRGFAFTQNMEQAEKMALENAVVKHLISKVIAVHGGHYHSFTQGHSEFTTPQNAKKILSANPVWTYVVTGVCPQTLGSGFYITKDQRFAIIVGGEDHIYVAHRTALGSTSLSLARDTLSDFLTLHFIKDLESLPLLVTHWLDHVTSDPARLGCALTVVADMKLPTVAQRWDGNELECVNQHMHIRRHEQGSDEMSIWVANAPQRLNAAELFRDTFEALVQFLQQEVRSTRSAAQVRSLSRDELRTHVSASFVQSFAFNPYVKSFSVSLESSTSFDITTSAESLVVECVDGSKHSFPFHRCEQWHVACGADTFPLSAPMSVMPGFALSCVERMPKHEDAKAAGMLETIVRFEPVELKFSRVDCETGDEYLEDRKVLTLHLPVLEDGVFLHPAVGITFFSHRWLAPFWCVKCNATKCEHGSGHPDHNQNTKLKTLKPLVKDYEMVWLDYWSVPQDDEDAATQAISCLPAYIFRCHQFVVLCLNDAHHKDYTQRGWCNLELLCASTPYVVKTKVAAQDRASLVDQHEIRATNRERLLVLKHGPGSERQLMEADTLQNPLNAQFTAQQLDVPRITPVLNWVRGRLDNALAEAKVAAQGTRVKFFDGLSEEEVVRLRALLA